MPQQKVGSFRTYQLVRHQTYTVYCDYGHPKNISQIFNMVLTCLCLLSFTNFSKQEPT